MKHRSFPHRHGAPHGAYPGPRRRSGPDEAAPWPSRDRGFMDYAHDEDDRGYPGVGVYEGVGGYPGGGQVGAGGYRGGPGYQSGGADYSRGEEYGWAPDEDEAFASPRGTDRLRRFAGPSPYPPGHGDSQWMPRGYGEGAAYRPRPQEDERRSVYGRGAGHRGKGPKGYTRSDERIREDLSERLAEDDEIDPGEVSIEVRDGVVTLSGSVEQRWMRYRIEDMAESCRGVTDVVDDLRVVRPSGGVAR